MSYKKSSEEEAQRCDGFVGKAELKQGNFLCSFLVADCAQLPPEPEPPTCRVTKMSCSASFNPCTLLRTPRSLR